MIGRLFPGVFAVWLVALATGAVPVQAQSYPNRPIKLIVAVLPGGPMDVMGRLIAQHLSSTIGQQVVVENRAGAGTTLGAKAVASADPDGYTLLLGNAATLAIGPTLQERRLRSADELRAGRVPLERALRHDRIAEPAGADAA
jgi:putative tricarboxylic transport membrane protein